MKKTLLLLLAFSLPAFAQSNSVYNASTYAYTTQVTQGNASTGSSSLRADPTAFAQGIPFLPYNTNASITINRNASNAETVALSAVANCYPNSLTCTLSGTFTYKHIPGETIQSGTFGLQEAINTAMSAGSGTVVIDATWQGPSGSSLITAATGNNNVMIQDNRNPSGAVFYQWNGSAYVATGGSGDFVCNVTNNCAELNATNSFSAINSFAGVRTGVFEDSTGSAGSTGETLANVGGETVWQPTPSPTLLPGNPNVIYTTVANGDQAGTVIHDVSGNGNNGTFFGSPFTPSWTGTGVSFYPNNGATGVGMPAAINGDQSFCMVAYTAPWTRTGTGPPSLVQLMSNSAHSSTDSNWWLQQNFQQQWFGGVGLSVDETNAHMGLHAFCITIQQTTPGTGLSLPGDTAYTDGFPITNLNAGNSNGILQSGTYNLGTGIESSGYILYYFAGWPGVLTPAQAMQVSNAMLQQVAARGQPIMPNTIYANPTDTQYLIAVGDSITNGNGVGSTQDWLDGASVSTGTYTKVNFGVSGFGTIQMLGEDSWQVSPYCNVQGGKSIVIIFGGTNDGPLGTAATLVANRLTTWATDVRKMGCTPGVGTMISRGASLDAFKDVLNPLIRQGAANGDYFLVDFASDPNVGCDGCNTNATYVQSDTVHPTVAGQALLGAAASNAIDYATGATSANPTVYTGNTVTMLSSDDYVNAVPTAAAAYTLPSCIGVVGDNYRSFNKSAGANTITFSGAASESITGSATLAQNLNAVFQSQLISNTAAGCYWLRVQ